MKPNSRIPMLLSAFACPGVGQFVQKRWIAGLVYGTGFLIGFFWIMAIALGVIYDFYKMAFDFDHEPEPQNLMAMVLPLIIAIVFYVANLFDVLIAQQRISTKANKARLTSMATKS